MHEEHRICSINIAREIAVFRSATGFKAIDVVIYRILGSWEIPTANSISRERSINNEANKIYVQAFI